MKEIGGSKTIQLLSEVRSEFNTDIQLSPDGNQVAFSNKFGQVSVYDFRISKLTDYSNSEISRAYQFTWLSDSETLLYLGTPEKFLVPDAHVGIYGISLSTGRIFRVLDWTDKRFRYGLHHLSLSKDGQWLTFYAPRISEMMAPDPNYAIYILDTSCFENAESCKESIRLVGDGHDSDWSPDGRLWWICSQETLSALCVTNTNSPASSKVFVTTRALTSSVDTSFYDFSWSPDGKYVVINLQGYQSNKHGVLGGEVFLIPVGGSQFIKVTPISEKNEHWDGWSPDGKYLAYSQILGYTEPYGDLGIRYPITDLYLYDIETGTKIDFTESPGDREVFGFFMNMK